MTRTLRLILVVALALTSLAALIAAGPLMTYGADRVQWLVRPAPLPAGAPASVTPPWTIAVRDGKRIAEVASVGRAPQQLANFGDRLAVLAGDGSWWLAARDGAVVAGPKLPDDRRPLAIAAGRGLLWFLTGAGDGRSLTTWDGRAFADAGPVPDSRPPAVDARLLVTRTDVIVASRLLDGVQVIAKDGDAPWHAADERIVAESAWLVQDDRRGPLLVARRGGEWSVRPIARDGTPGPPTTLPADGVPREASASIVDGDVRLSWADGEQLVERAFDPANRSVGPPTRVRPTAASDASAPSTFDRVASWMSMLAIGVLLMTAGRGRAEPAKRDAADATPIPAALPRRLAAGLIDAWPLYAASAYVVLTSDRIGEELVRLDAPRDRLVILAGSLAYAIVNFLFEWRWHRTPGKMLFGLRVVADATGATPTTRSILIRNALRLLDLNLVTLLIVPLSRQRQRLGDLVAGTVVVDASPQKLDKLDAPIDAGDADLKR